MNNLYLDKRIGSIRLTGRSLAGEETVIAAPELDVCFDIGRAPREMIPINHIFISHGHIDHCANVAYYFSHREFLGMAPGRIYAHRSLAGAFQRLQGVWADLERRPSTGTVTAVLPGDEIPIRRGLLVRAFDVNHDNGALGFVTVEKRHKLKPEYMTHTGPQLAALKKEGVEIEYSIEKPLVAYCGDTAAGDFLDRDDVRTAEVILLECTFYQKDHLVRARKGNHIHVSDLPSILERLENPNVVFTHITHRTSIREAKRMIFDVINQRDHDRVSVFMDRFTHMNSKVDSDESSV